MSTAYGRAIAYTAIYEGTSFVTLNSSKIYHADEREFENTRTCTVHIDAPHSGTVDSDLTDALSYKSFPIPAPTVLFLKPGHLQSTVASIVKQASKSWILYPFARQHKLASLNEGYITKDSLWDRLVYEDARAKIIGENAGTIRGAIISGGV